MIESCWLEPSKRGKALMNYYLLYFDELQSPQEKGLVSHSGKDSLRCLSQAGNLHETCGKLISLVYSSYQLEHPYIELVSHCATWCWSIMALGYEFPISFISNGKLLWNLCIFPVHWSRNYEWRTILQTIENRCNIYN